MSEENRNCIKETENYLYERYLTVCRLPSTELSPMITNPPLDESEARYFIRGLGEGLFSVDDEGYVQSQLLPLRSGKNTKQKTVQLFWAKRKNGGWGLFREGVCQLATISSLVFKYGWRPDQIILEPSRAEFKHLAYGVDILIRDNDRKIAICGEVKGNRRQFQKLLEGFRYCCQRGPHKKADCHFKTNHAKYEFCSDVRPAYFFATAPGEQVCFRLTSTSVISIQDEQQTLVYSDAEVLEQSESSTSV